MKIPNSWNSTLNFHTILKNQLCTRAESTFNYLDFQLLIHGHNTFLMHFMYKMCNVQHIEETCMYSLNALQMNVHHGHQQIFTRLVHTCLGFRHVSNSMFAFYVSDKLLMLWLSFEEMKFKWYLKLNHLFI